MVKKFCYKSGGRIHNFLAISLLIATISSYKAIHLPAIL